MEGKGTGGWIVVVSPHNGREVKVRLKDVGRTVRDSDNKPFYLLKRSGGGYYGSLTREGGAEQEASFDRMKAKERATKKTGQATTKRQVHDATGRPRSGAKGKLILLVILFLIGLAVWAFLFGPLKGTTSIDDIQKKLTPDSSKSSTP